MRLLRHFTIGCACGFAAVAAVSPPAGAQDAAGNIAEDVPLTPEERAVIAAYAALAYDDTLSDSERERVAANAQTLIMTASPTERAAMLEAVHTYAGIFESLAGQGGDPARGKRALAPLLASEKVETPPK